MKLKYIKPSLPLRGISENPAVRRPERGLGKVLTIFYLILFHCIFLLSSLTAAEYGKTILALYKTSDGFSENNNPIKSHLDQEIKKFGLKIEYRSFESGMPAKNSLNDIRAVITWYYSGVVDSKQTGLDYIEFLKSAIDSGCKLIIINSFGAYGYKEGGTEKWDLVNDINPLFKKLGFFFKGFWTNDPAKLSLVSIDTAVAEKDAKQNVKVSKHYQQIVPVRKDVESHLIIRRTDTVPGLGDGNSSVILTSKNGGFALENYVTSGSSLLLNTPEFLRRSLFFDDGTQDVCVILGDIKNKNAVIENFSYAFKYAKIKNTVIDTEKLRKMVAPDLRQFNAAIIATDTLKDIPFGQISEYVKSGGHLIFAKQTDMTDQYKEMLGVKAYGFSSSFTEGFSYDPAFFMNNVNINEAGTPVAVRKTSLIKGKVLATLINKSAAKDYPVLWETGYGKGRILYWNINLLTNINKAYRGALVQSIQHIYSGFVSAMANIGMMMIDDLPAPLWNTNYRQYRIEYYNNQMTLISDEGQKDKIRSIIRNLQNYTNVTDTNFIGNTWYKDMEALEKQIGFKYSAYLIFNYNRKTVLNKNELTYPIIDFYLAENNIPAKLGFNVLNKGWELGLHGYNHQSLTVTKPQHYDSLPWADKNSMVKALTAARDEWIGLYGEATLPFSYVAPHNIIDSAGLSALSEVFPSIKIVSTLYTAYMGEIEQEFEWTKDGRFFQIPRISSGYIIHPATKKYMFDILHNFGVISHFVHPDDVFDEHRSTGFAGWNNMKTSFTADFLEFKKCNPALRWMTSKDAFDEFQFYNSTNISVKESGKTIIVESSDGSERYLYFRLRLNKGQKIKSVQNCQIVNADKKSGDVILKTTEYLSKIVLN